MYHKCVRFTRAYLPPVVVQLLSIPVLGPVASLIPRVELEFSIQSFLRKGRGRGGGLDTGVRGLGIKKVYAIVEQTWYVTCRNGMQVWYAIRYAGLVYRCGIQGVWYMQVWYGMVCR